MTAPQLGASSAPAIGELCARGMTDPVTAAELTESLFAPDRPVVVRGDPRTGVVASAVRDGQGFIRLLVVDPAHRGRGLGASLLAAAEADLAGATTSVVVGADAPDYLVPGVDTRCTALASLLEGRGYVRRGANINMAVDLRSLPAVPDGPEPAHPGDETELRAWLEEHYPSWVDEAVRGLRKGTVVLSRDADGVSGFAAWDVNRGGWFGPMAVRPSARQQGIGAPLLVAALHRMAESGREQAEIAWVSTVAFYAKSVGARISKTYLVYRKAL